MRKILLFGLIIVIPLLNHAQDKISADRIIEMINNGQNVSLSNQSITGVLDFTDLDDTENTNKLGSWLGGNQQYESEVDVTLSFYNCIFEDDVLAFYSKNDDSHIAHFSEEVIFENCQFLQESSFKYSEFSENVSFAGCIFKEKANFKYANFDENVDFSSAMFMRSADFKYAEIPENISFSAAIFEENADFKYTEFDRGADFSNSIFKDRVDFKYTEFSKPLNFSKVVFQETPDTKYTEVDGREFTSFSDYY